MCSSGDKTASAAETAQAKFTDTLSAAFTKQYAAQGDLLNFLQTNLKPQIENPQGLSPEALAAQRTSATDTLSSQYDNATKALQNSQFIRGGENLPSGVDAMATGALKTAQASDTAAAQNTITQNNENLKQQNYWNAMQTLSGVVAPQYNPTGYAGATNQGAGAVSALSNSVTNSKAQAMSPFTALIAGGAGVGAAFAGKKP